MVVIPNGFDLGDFSPSEKARVSVRQELNIAEKAFIIGLVARYHKQKDHENFFQAAHLLMQSIDEKTHDIHFLLCGDKVSWNNDVLVKKIDTLGRRDRFHLLGKRKDMPRLTASLDIAVSSSYSEAFPNVLGEAMACAVPCVVTDVGDSALIVGNTGKVVPSKNPGLLAHAMKELIELGEDGRRKLGEAARQRVMDHFNLPDIVLRYEALYRQIVEGKA